VAKLYNKGTNNPPLLDNPEHLLALVGAFVAACQTPVLLEYGEEMMPLQPGEYALELRSGRVWIDVLHGERSLSRRILTVENSGIGTLDCTIHRFGNAPGKLTFLDAAKPQTAHRKLSGVRHSFGEQFRRMLYRQFPNWKIDCLSSGMDLQRSFSPVFPRARLMKGGQRIAAMACPGSGDEHALLTFALIWLDYLGRRSSASTQLCLFLPEDAGCLTAHRLHWLDHEKVAARIFRFNRHGSAGEVDILDLGNLDSRVSPRYEHPSPIPIAPNERFLEAVIRDDVAAIEPRARQTPVHGQVITFAATDRDIVDLLAVSFDGRLIVLELKAAEDIHLPIQALDYWLRVLWHVRRGELTHLFPGIPLQPEPPLLRLVAPALAFHSTTATVLRYFSPEIDVERVGINSDWSAKLKVILRLKKGDAPQSHGGQHAEFTRN
jgi:hypothetical protein